MRLLRFFPLCVLVALPLCGAAAFAQEAAPAARIVNPIDEQQLVTLKGTMHPLANARNDRGAAPDGMQLDRMHLVLKRSNSQEAALRALIAEMHTPGTAFYHKWLTPDSFGKQFGPSDQDITTVETWLTDHGFSVAKVNPGKQTIEFSGNVAQFRSAFHAQIHKYVVNGEAHYANSADPQIPAALAPVVGGFVSLNNFRARSYVKYLGKASYDPKTDKATPQWTMGNSTNGYSFVLAPQDYDVQYDLTPLYTAGTNGSGQTIAIINESNINIGLVNQFRSLFSLPFNPPQVIIDGNDPGVDGINDPDGPNGASTEAYLDVEWSGAVAPNATIDLVIGADTALESGLFLAMEHAVYGNVAPVMSLSFGNCEAIIGAATNAFISGLWEQAAAQGITVMVSAGDSGSAGCDSDDTQEYAVEGQAVSGFASTPYNVAVGGTDFYYSDYSQGLAAMEAQLGTYWSTTASNNTPAVSIKGVIPEQPWNDSQYGLTFETLEQGASPQSTSISAGSGGTSSTYTTKPAWQTGFGDTARDLPDISLFASNGPNFSYYPICASDGDCQPVSSSGTVQISGVGGTSASSPSFAGIMALVNQKYGRQGQADFVLYPLSKQFPTAFNDVKNGTNTVPCEVGTTGCITVTDPVTIIDPNTDEEITEGEIGTGTTAEYNAVAGYDEASGLGTIDANQLVTNWGSVKFAATTVTLTPSETSFTHGTAITVSGSVSAASGTPTGDVALMTNSTEEGQQGKQFFTLSNGSYTGSNSTLPGGTYNIWGQYGGDTGNALNTSTPVQITVSQEASGIAFSIFSSLGTYTASSTPGSSVDYGTQLNLSAHVTPSSQLTAEESCIAASTACPVFTEPTGTVAFSDSGKALNTALVNVEGDAEYNAPFSVGAHSVTASYAGDLSYSASTASAIAFAVVKDTPTVVLNVSIVDSSDNNLVNGPSQPTVLTVQLENTAQYNSGSAVPVAAPTGTVTLSSSLSGFSGNATLSSATDPSTGALMGVATYSVPAGSVSGSYAVTVTYNGDANYNTNSASYNIPVETTSGDGGLTSTVAATMSGSISPTTNVTISGTVSGPSGQPAPTGDVNVYSSGNAQIGAGLVPGSANSSTFSVTLNSQNLFQGSNQITIQYFGDTNYNPSALVLTNPISNPLSDFSLIPETTIVPISVSGSGGSGTDTINLASINGFSGAVNLTCSGAAGVTCSISPAAPSLSSGGNGTATLTVDAGAGTPNLSYDVLVTGTDSTGKYVHTLGLQAVVTGSAAGSTSFGLSANPASLSLAPGATTGNTSTITVAPIGAFTATVDLSCAITGPPIPSGFTVPTCAMAQASVASGSGTDGMSVTTASTDYPTTYTATVTGTSGTLPSQTTTVSVTIAAAGSGTYALTNSGAISVIPGATTGNTSTITVTPSGGFTGTVTLTCAIAPTAASDPATCSLSPASLTAFSGTTPQTSTLTVSTTAATSSQNEIKKLFWPSAGGATLALVLFFGIPKRRNWLAMLGLLVIFVVAAGMGCGGGSGGGGGGGGGGNTGTTAGTYTVTVTGNSGSITQTTTVALTVN